METPDAILSAWDALEVAIVRAENATLHDVGERMADMKSKRKRFNALIIKYLIEQQAKELK